VEPYPWAVFREKELEENEAVSKLKKFTTQPWTNIQWDEK
jgi:hypothetical protein